jgi:hypothetical protein
MRHPIPVHPHHADHARRAHARARLRRHELRGLRSVDLAVRAADDAVARLLLARADQAHLDARAIAAEHDLEAVDLRN